MDAHEALAVRIAVSDLRYVGGSILDARGSARSWPLLQWGTMVAYEAARHLRATHGVDLELSWEPEIAAAARHSGKYFDGRRDYVESVVKDFDTLIDSTHEAFYPADRRGRLFDSLRHDLSVFTAGNDVVLTNLTGHFMVGLPPERAAKIATWGPHLAQLSTGVGEATARLTSETVDSLRAHGSRSADAIAAWDGDIADVAPSIFGGQLSPPVTMALLSVLSSTESAQRWTRVECCDACAAASLKHRFVVLHHATMSLLTLQRSGVPLDGAASARVSAITSKSPLDAIVSQPMRRLRNGWFHLGLSDVARSVTRSSNALTPTHAYTEMRESELAATVDAGLAVINEGLQAWVAERGRDNKSLFEHLKKPR
jgi:hypothetical protein